MAVAPISRVHPGHPDHNVLAALAADIWQRVPDRLDVELGERALDAVEFVLDPVRTGRTRLSELDNVEKTFVGLKIEHFIRDLLDAPKGVRDLVLGGYDVDVKNTVGDSWCWMIPPETIREQGPCLLIASNEHQRRSWMGLILARAEYLGAPNRDMKRRINSNAFSNILWLANGVEWPPNRWTGLDMVRFRQLRKLKVSGAHRAAAFFSENLGRPIHRRVVMALLHDQLDPMKRLRGNAGAKDILKPQGIALLSGNYFNPVLQQLGLPRIGNDEHMAVKASTPKQIGVLRAVGQL
ncbi:NaeI family type II restriction endonuclease [Sphingomonas jatrophae]|uniref:Restriction endonuclease NaeI n=1 Tax=Sphingomonas jatrophae TaxID=1166337 RepID=A0A1I6JRH3_9SPHN|nr:NaeI family type II restriction endonuclease [Sphingomonas jatrophae]SFR81573.1 Restriction endonuclease NaeI [Sphingomonas jatrophae]